MTGRAVWPAKPVSAKVLLRFDFSSDAVGSATIDSQSTSVSVHSGVDGSPNDILQGTSVLADTTVDILVQAGNAGTIYEVKCAATMDDTTVLVKSGFLAVVPDVL